MIEHDAPGLSPADNQQLAVATRQPRKGTIVAKAPAMPTTPMDLLRIVTERGASVEEIGKFMDLMERQQAIVAKSAFVRAMAAFKKDPPEIYKRRMAEFKTEKGWTAYSYANLDDVCSVIIAALAEHDISHDWTPQQSGSSITITCTITHADGHSKSASMTAENDKTGSKNAIQAIGSAASYLERYTLLAVCGLSVSDGSDDDGAAAGLDPDAVKKAVEERAPAKHAINKTALDNAIASIKRGNYEYESLIGYYALTPEQLAFVDAQLDRSAA